MPELGEEVWDCLHAYNWPGNNRELRNALERALVLSGEGAISPEVLPTTLEPGRIGFAEGNRQ